MYTIGSKRSGFTLTELLVAASLMVGLLAIVGPLTVRSGRLWQDTRHQQLAIDELSNQLERLTSLDPQSRNQALDDLELSESLKQAWPAAALTSETISDEEGTRLELSLSWNAIGTRSRTLPRPITLVGWLDPMPTQTPSEEDSP